MARTSVVNVDGARVAYRLHGQGPAVVLVNGTAALDVHWGPVIAELGKQRTVISLDYRSFFEIQRCQAPLETITKEDMTNGRPQGVCELRATVLFWTGRNE